MGQVLHGSATTTHAIRAAIQRSKASLQALSERHGINPKTVAKWRRRASAEDRPMGPKVPHSTVLSAEEEIRTSEWTLDAQISAATVCRAAQDRAHLIARGCR